VVNLAVGVPVCFGKQSCKSINTAVDDLSRLRAFCLKLDSDCRREGKHTIMSCSTPASLLLSAM
jgi:hypothetical protein